MRADDVNDSAHPVLLYDGECGLCCRSIRFIHKHDPRGRYRFAPLQGDAGARLLREHGLPEDTRDTVVLLRRGRAHTHSDAALRTLGDLDAPWPLVARIGRLAPRPLRDAVYRLVSRNRHKVFHARACSMADPALRRKMLE